ncbi:MAG: hypothetical protein WC327_05075 [Candidatus Cloacimonadia bacterium]
MVEITGFEKDLLELLKKFSENVQRHDSKFKNETPENKGLSTGSPLFADKIKQCLESTSEFINPVTMLRCLKKEFIWHFMDDCVDWDIRGWCETILLYKEDLDPEKDPHPNFYQMTIRFLNDVDEVFEKHGVPLINENFDGPEIVLSGKKLGGNNIFVVKCKYIGADYKTNTCKVEVEDDIGRIWEVEKKNDIPKHWLRDRGSQSQKININLKEIPDYLSSNTETQLAYRNISDLYDMEYDSWNPFSYQKAMNDLSKHFQLKDVGAFHYKGITVYIDYNPFHEGTEGKVDCFIVAKGHYSFEEGLHEPMEMILETKYEFKHICHENYLLLQGLKVSLDFDRDVVQQVKDFIENIADIKYNLPRADIKYNIPRIEINPYEKKMNKLLSEIESDKEKDLSKILFDARKDIKEFLLYEFKNLICNYRSIEEWIVNLLSSHDNVNVPPSLPLTEFLMTDKSYISEKAQDLIYSALKQVVSRYNYKDDCYAGIYYVEGRSNVKSEEDSKFGWLIDKGFRRFGGRELLYVSRKKLPILTQISEASDSYIIELYKPQWFVSIKFNDQLETIFEGIEGITLKRGSFVNLYKLTITGEQRENIKRIVEDVMQWVDTVTEAMSEYILYY